MVESVSPEPLRVLVADDHDLFRRGLARLLDEVGIEVVGEAADGMQAVQLCHQLRPDVVVMDLQMPDMSGIEATRAIAESQTEAQVTVLTVAGEESKVIDALLAGACGYVLKDSDGDDIVAAIRAASVGESVISPRVAAKVVNRLRQEPSLRSSSNGGTELSDRELDVLKLIAAGYANPLIAERLFISENTVKNHVSSIFAKLGVDNRVQATVKAIRDGLVDTAEQVTPSS
jgi:DNA-binding NarL/FixJ family response regulator